MRYDRIIVEQTRAGVFVDLYVGWSDQRAFFCRLRARRTSTSSRKVEKKAPEDLNKLSSCPSRHGQISSFYLLRVTSSKHHRSTFVPVEGAALELDFSIPAEVKDSPGDMMFPIEVHELIMTFLVRDSLLTMRMVSKRHLEITRKTYFRAQWFYKQYQRCESIYRASCHPFLFSPELLKVSITHHLLSRKV